MANKVNKGFTPESKGVELKSTAVSVPQYSHEEKTQVRRDSNSHLLKLASILIVILVIAIVVIGVYYAKEVRDNDDDETERDKITLRSTSAPTLRSTSAPTLRSTSAPTLRSTSAPTLRSTSAPTLPTCLNDKCVRSAAAILGFMNRSVDPCDDFYSFACGGWLSKTFIPTTETEVHVFFDINKDNKEFMRNILANPDTRAKYSANRAVLKAIDYYQTCLSKVAINAQGDKYLKEVVAQLGGCNLTTRNWNSSAYDVHKAMLTAFGKLGLQPFFHLGVYPDFANSSKKSFAISDGGIVLSDTYYTEKNSTQELYEKNRSSYRQYMIDVMVLFGAARKEAEKQMEEVYLLEENIATVFKTRTGHPHSSTIEELSNYTKFDWYSFLSELTANQSYKLSKDEVVLVRTKDVLKGVAALINNTDKAIISNYMAWIAVEHVIRHLPDQYSDAHLAYKQRILGLTYEDSERWDFCYEQTKKTFPFPIGLIFIEHNLNPGAKERVTEIFEEIRKEFLFELDQQTWMDDSTKAQAKEKAEASGITVAYPDFIKDEEKLNAEYEEVHVNRSEYLKTVFTIQTNEFMKTIQNYKKPVDRNAITHSPADINAYHYRQKNTNIFLAGILRSPFYDDENLRASNYGAIGMIAGHELTHGFDINGRIYDKYGNQRNWWTRNSTRNFLRKSQCLVNQYGEFELFGKKLNGQATLGENIADNGGLKFAYEAYKGWVARNGEENKLPGLDYTPNQLFFISYAQAWCAKYTLQGALEQIDNKPWPPMGLRVKGVITNSEHFSDAFQCPLGSNMNPEKKCSVW